MNFEKYQTETIRTFAYRKTSLTTTMTDMLHCAIGVSTESGELVASMYNNDVINTGEEIADILWYLSNLANFIKMDLQKEITLSKVKTYTRGVASVINDDIVILSGELMDIFKKSIYYNKELDLNNLKEKVKAFIHKLNELCLALGLELENLMDKNIAKLRIRFPDKFTEDLAENRDLESERKALED